MMSLGRVAAAVAIVAILVAGGVADGGGSTDIDRASVRVSTADSMAAAASVDVPQGRAVAGVMLSDLVARSLGETVRGEVVAASARLSGLRESAGTPPVGESTYAVVTREEVVRASSGGPGSGSASPAGGGTVSTSSGYDTVRAALDAVGGGAVPLEESSAACGLACASSRGVITFRPDLAAESGDKILWVMSHELAHIHQFRVWDALQASTASANLFGGDMEHLANCMAEVRGYASIGCSAEQQGFAAGVWSGQVG